MKFPRDIQVIAVTGHNQKLRKRLQSLAGHAGNKVRVYGWSENINELMDASDALITKPGGVTVSEALVKSSRC